MSLPIDVPIEDEGLTSGVKTFTIDLSGSTGGATLARLECRQW